MLHFVEMKGEIYSENLFLAKRWAATCNLAAGAKQPVHWFLGGKVVVIQQGSSARIGSPSP
jgi:hypothetical protein